jgi:hypothetical protein
LSTEHSLISSKKKRILHREEGVLTSLSHIIVPTIPDFHGFLLVNTAYSYIYLPHHRDLSLDSLSDRKKAATVQHLNVCTAKPSSSC